MTAPVRIVRDSAGVPHIYAQSQNDLFFAQGFVQAQDRLFQMDLWRRAAQGRLSEVLGPNFVERDAMTRRVQYRGDRDREWASYGSDARAIANAFVTGVNAWVSLARARPPEEFVLAGWKPDLWAADDLLNRTDAFVAGGDAIDEIFRARLVAALGARRAATMVPGDRPIVVSDGLDVGTINPIVGDAIRRVGTPPFFVGLAAPVSSPARAPAAGVNQHQDNGAVHTLDHPSRAYLVHLHAPGWNVIGLTPPWLPGVAVGRNDRIAWNAEPFEADTQDVFVEKLNPSNPHQVDDNGRWVDTDLVKDPIAIRANPKPFVYDTEYTRHGVIVALDRTRNLAFALRWSGSEPGTAAGLAALALDRASSVAEFTAALSKWKMPARRFAYRTADGQSGSQIAALIPVRRGWNGAVPAPAWSGSYEWDGWQAPGESAPSANRKTSPAATLARWARAHPDRADALLAKLAGATGRDASTRQNAAIDEALADASRELDASVGSVLFAHPLAITDAARRRFNIGPLAIAGATTVSSLRARQSFEQDDADWNHWTAMNAPGQSGAPDGAHFGDLAVRWAAGQSMTLPFTDDAVQAVGESTLALIRRPQLRK